MVLAAELEPKRHYDPGDVAPAEDSVTTREREELGDRITLFRGRSTHLALPGLVDPPDHREGQILLVFELVVKGAARVAGLARHLLEHEVAIAVAGQTPRR